jgi:hypothetical protein
LSKDVATHERPSAERAKIVAAGHAAASWARARRASWTDAPLVIPQPPPPAELFRPPPPLPPEPAGPGLGERAGEWVAASGEPLKRWVPRLAIVAALIAAAVFGGPPLLRSITSTTPTRVLAPAAAPARGTPAAPTRSTGTLAVRSTPEGARVIVDGTPKGTTPVTISELPLGHHTVILESSAGTIERTITVTAGTVAEMDESIFSGFVTIYSPFEVAVTEGTRALSPDDRNQLMLPPGRHDLRLTNRALGFDEIRRVDLKPGQKATVSIAPQRSSISVTTSEPGDVWIDGARIGDAPIANVPVDLGTHEVVVRRTAGGERRFTITATVKPTVLNVDFSKP